jgi:hypothetical protein
MRYRKLGILWSVVWGMLAVLLTQLWVRSYWREDTLVLSQPSTFITVQSSRGEIEYFDGGWMDSRPNTSRWYIETEPARPDKETAESGFTFTRLRYNESALTFPQWCPFLASTMLAALPWLRWRFSLRTLLICMTLVAVALGNIFALSR